MKLAVPAGLTAKLKNIKPLGVASKAVGVVGIGVALYDAHNWGKLKSYENKNIKNANAAWDYFNNTQYLDNKSHITSKIKKTFLNCELDNSLRGSWTAATGYLSGFGEILGKNIIPLAASVGAIALRGKKSLLAAGALGLYAATSVFRHSSSHLNHKI